MIIREGNMDIIMDQTNLTAIEGMLRTYLNLPGEQLQVENVFTEKHNLSEFIHFTVPWPSDSILPHRLVLKRNHDTGREVLFYLASQAHGTPLPVPVYLGGEYNLATGLSQVLLEDLTLSHSDLCSWPTPIPFQAGLDLVEALARLHTAFWDKPMQDFPSATLPDFLRDEPSYLAHIDYLKRDFEIYVAGMGDCLEIGQCQIYPEMLALLPGLWNSFWKSRLSGRPLPLIHGDLNPRNFLYPNHSGGKVVLIDWEAHRLGLPGEDLAMLLGMHLCPEFDDALPFIRHYHHQLVQAGIKDYSFDDLIADYEISLIYGLFYPLKLYAQFGIQDESLIQNSILALNSIRQARF
jgi:hypothetical protein